MDPNQEPKTRPIIPSNQSNQATTWVKRESEQKYKADFAAGRTLGGKKVGGLPGGWGAFGGKSSASGKGASSGWAPSWMKAAEPEPEPEPEVVEAVRRRGRPMSSRATGVFRYNYPSELTRWSCLCCGFLRSWSMVVLFTEARL